MRFHPSVVLVVALLAVVASCGDDSHEVPTGGKHWLVDFERVTLASDTPDRVEIELVIRTGTSLLQAAPDGTVVAVTASSGQFASASAEIRVATSDGHALLTLLLPPERPARITVTARVATSQADLSILVDQAGGMRLGV